MAGSGTRIRIGMEERRQFMAYFSSIGLSGTLLPGVLWARLHGQDESWLTEDVVADAEKIAGLQFTEEERALMLSDLQEFVKDYEEIRQAGIENSVPPAIQFNPRLPGISFEAAQRPQRFTQPEHVKRPDDLDSVAFWPVLELVELLRTEQVSSLELTEMYLSRIKKYNPVLKCVITVTEELALKQAKRADAEIAAGKYRGILHGIPWGAKDLLATKGYRTTWGAITHKDQVLDYDATVVQRLEQAGAVLVAKLAMGELAWGDVWYGGKIRNPEKPDEGPHGSSAGSAAATAAGLLPFSLGSETYGSIVSPATQCGVTGLRPTYGRVSRHGAMALSWSMDKIGPICRSAEDCAVVFDAIRGPDGKDITVTEFPFNWDARFDVTKLRVGYVKSEFEKERKDEPLWRQHDLDTLEVLRSIGIELIPIELPQESVSAMSFILTAEAGAAFSHLVYSGREDQLVRQGEDAWPNVFRQAHFIPAVEYIQANRLRTKLMQSMAELMADIDVYVIPTYADSNLLLTNLTGHPMVVAPNGFKEDSTPTSISMVGKLYGEAKLLRLAKAYQEVTDFHREHPDLEEEL